MHTNDETDHAKRLSEAIERHILSLKAWREMETSYETAKRVLSALRDQLKSR